ncbi:MAG: ribonuclease J [Candidatus Levybacteria bacterium]|nr:ribonuclease J [Candidatus Levybacteria bacterium]
MDQAISSQPIKGASTVSFIPIGGIGEVTKNMYLYEYGNEILIVDCGIGFPDESMLGVDLLLPDISYLQSTNKKIVGMVLTHGHEDHIGALPFLLPQLPQMPIFASPLTAALANEKLKEFQIKTTVQTVRFDGQERRLGSFSCTFVHITHSIPDTANILIRTPVGMFYHGSDFKLDITPADGVKTDYLRIAKAGEQGVLALMSDCLGADRKGFSQSEDFLGQSFERAILGTQGKCIITTYSSNISRLNQAVHAAEKLNRKVCFVGRSIVKAKMVGQRLGYLQIKGGTEVPIERVGKYRDSQLVLLVAGSQGQENSAMSRIASGDHKEITLTGQDTVVFSSDTIPGNERTVNALLDTIAKKGAKILYSDTSSEFHVSGHGSEGDLMLMMSLTKPKFIVPISGTYRHLIAYKSLVQRVNKKNNNVYIVDNGQELIFSQNSVSYGRKFDLRTIYVDQISGEEIEGFVLRDREQLAKEGIVILMVEVNVGNGQLVNTPEIVTRGFSPTEADAFTKSVRVEMQGVLSRNKGRVTNWVHIRKVIEETVTKHIFEKLHRRPLVLPVIIEV